MIEKQQWDDFIQNGLASNYDEQGSNVRYPFSKMTQRFGKAYIDYLASSYAAKDDMTDEEFCRINGGVPESFLRKLPVVESVNR